MVEFRLIPEKDVEIKGDDAIATSDMPWLRIQLTSAIIARSWIRLRYRTSFFDEPVRPLIRFQTADGSASMRPMNGPVFGCAEWVGLVPDQTTFVSVSPTNRIGPFNFELDSIEFTNYAPKRAAPYPWNKLFSAGARLMRRNKRPQVRLQTYDRRYNTLVRPLDTARLDRPRADWQRTPNIRLITTAQRTNIDRLERTLESLRSQMYPHWSLCVLITDDTPANVVSGYRRLMRSEPRLAMIDVAAPLSFITEPPRDEWVGIVELGDTLPSYALAVVVETLDRAPNHAVIYGDEDAQDTSGRRHSPVLKPDWSPELQARSPYIGRLMLVCVDTLWAQCRTAAEFLLAEGEVVARIMETIPYEFVGHIRRVLYTRETNTRSCLTKPAVAHVNKRQPEHSVASQWPKVAIIIPTRDRADLLAECISGLNEMTDYPHFEVLIVDNGTTSPDARALLRDIGRHRNYTVLSRPGPFNYPALCNDGVAATGAPVLVFLNNDVSMFNSDWLRPLAAWCIHPRVGAVGAKLLYPQRKSRGRIQHAGVVLGVRDFAGHIYSDTRGDECGYMGHLAFAHEVSAVTGACLAVERCKFEATGGFDPDNLPVDLNDIDLCLRLAARGWRTMWTPEAMLYHRESASRGSSIDHAKTYHKERSYFSKKWANVIRDDPFFHPAFSLYSHTAIELA